jgi:hypothetical protein
MPKKNKSMKSIMSFFDLIAPILFLWKWVVIVIAVCVVVLLILLGISEGKALEEDEFKLLSRNLDLAGCQESRNELIKKVNSGKVVTNGDAANSRTECEKELKQTAYKAQQKTVAE